MKRLPWRPSEYKEEYVQEVLDYLDTCGREQTKLPKRSDLALKFNCTKETLANWGKEHPDFLSALMRIDLQQEGSLIDDGFYGGKEVNPRMAQFLLSANHGFKEVSKEEVELTNIEVAREPSHEE